MTYKATIYKVMIASPGDVATERKLIREILQDWNFIHSEDKKVVLMPVGWETHSYPEMGKRPQGIINKQMLEGCDLLVAVFWTRIGTSTGQSISGTVEEIERHINSRKPVMIYFSSAPVRLDSVDDNQYRALKEFKKGCYEKGLVEDYESISEFREKFSRQLAQNINNHPYFSTENKDNESIKDLDDVSGKTNIPTLSNEAKVLIIEASNDSSGVVLKLAVTSGIHIQTNDKQFVKSRDPRSRAKWEGALKELCDYGLMEERGHKGEVYGVTNEGYRIADYLKSIQEN